MKSLYLSLGGALSLILAGCAHHCAVLDSSEQTKIGKVGHSMFETEVTISNPGLHSQGELYQANAVLTNQTQYEQTVKYQFQWSTIEGYAAGENQGWIPVTLSPQRTQPVSSMSPHKNAVHYKISVCKEGK